MESKTEIGVAYTELMLYAMTMMVPGSIAYSGVALLNYTIGKCIFA